MSTGEDASTWTLLSDDMSEQELLDTARQAREGDAGTCAACDKVRAAEPELFQ